MTFQEFKEKQALWKQIRRYYGPLWRWRKVKW